MKEILIRLIYVSTNTIEGDDKMVMAEIEQILATARHKNAENHVTGALMFNAGCFAQVLEGEQEAVQDTFERIQYDRRHSEVVMLSLEPIAQREFSNWSMAYHGVNTKASEMFADITDKSGFNAENLKSHDIFNLVKQHLIEAESA
jgi:hypothetical protein